MNSDRRPPPPRRGPPRRGPAPSGRRPPPRQGQRPGPPPGRGRPPGRRPPTGPRPAPRPQPQDAGFDLDDVAPGDGAAFASRPRAKSFEIRKGKRRSDEEEQEDVPIGAVALPQSITSEEEGNELKSRLGVESLPDLDRRHGSVKVTQSRGASGPDRRRIGLKIFLVLLVLAAIGLGVAWQMGMLEGVIPK